MKVVWRESGGIARGGGIQVDDELDANRIDYIGGGPPDTKPYAYMNSIHRTLRTLKDAPWQAWWARGELGVLQVAWFVPPWALKTRHLVRERTGVWVAEVHCKDGVPLKADHPRLAHDDVLALMAKLRDRTGLGPHPELPLVELTPADRQAFQYNKDRAQAAPLDRPGSE